MQPIKSVLYSNDTNSVFPYTGLTYLNTKVETALETLNG